MEGVAQELRGTVAADPRPEGMIWRIEGLVEIDPHSLGG
jgi:hypothetical protein